MELVNKQMDERRNFFRITNNGDILARISQHTLDLIDISASGASIITNSNLPQSGIIDLSINNFSMKIQYEILRSDQKNTIIVFNQESEINRLFTALKNLRDERKRHHL
jgi:hypothetical protein